MLTLLSAHQLLPAHCSPVLFLQTRISRPETDNTALQPYRYFRCSKDIRPSTLTIQSHAALVNHIQIKHLAYSHEQVHAGFRLRLSLSDTDTHTHTNTHARTHAQTKQWKDKRPKAVPSHLTQRLPHSHCVCDGAASQAPRG